MHHLSVEWLRNRGHKTVDVSGWQTEEEKKISKECNCYCLWCNSFMRGLVMKYPFHYSFHKLGICTFHDQHHAASRCGVNSLAFNRAYIVLPAPSRGESTLNSPAVKRVPNLPSRGVLPAWSASWCNCNRWRLCTTHSPTPEGWKAELAWSVGWCVQFYPKTVTC